LKYFFGIHLWKIEYVWITLKPPWKAAFLNLSRLKPALESIVALVPFRNSIDGLRLTAQFRLATIRGFLPVKARVSALTAPEDQCRSARNVAQT
jgi:hypothetical protein